MNKYHINVTVQNKVGVLNRITSVFSNLHINIADLTLTGGDSGELADIYFGFDCNADELKLLTGKLQKIYYVCSVSETA